MARDRLHVISLSDSLEDCAHLWVRALAQRAVDGLVGLDAILEIRHLAFGGLARRLARIICLVKTVELKLSASRALRARSATLNATRLAGSGRDREPGGRALTLALRLRHVAHADAVGAGRLASVVVLGPVGEGGDEGPLLASIAGRRGRNEALTLFLVVELASPSILETE